jgi:hypothetical protein
MLAPEGFQGFSCGRDTAFGHIFASLSDAFFGVCPRRNIEQVLIGFSVLRNRGGLAIDRQNNRAFRFFELLEKCRGMVPKRGQGLHVLRDVDGDAPLPLPLKVLYTWGCFDNRFREIP